ncbi:MAG TPA: dioxygenase [Rhodobacteraceae bacterium]|nr:dioxygenase [Paracoccaceae bacterium]
MPAPQPALFLSHGAPTLLIEDSPAHDFLANLGQSLERPRAIVVCSAHYEAPAPRASSAARPATIHDFRGFPEELHRFQYPVPGAPGLARDIARRLQQAGFAAETEPARGLDHGIWNPLALIWPEPDIPVVALSITPFETPDYHYRMGKALAGLRQDGVLLIGSGSMTHNLRRFFGGNFRRDSPEDPGARAFADWIAGRVAAGDRETLLAGVDAWPEGRQNHPTDDHILPLFFAMGAGSPASGGTRLHASTNYAILAMDMLGFDMGQPAAAPATA